MGREKEDGGVLEEIELFLEGKGENWYDGNVEVESMLYGIEATRHTARSCSAWWVQIIWRNY